MTALIHLCVAATLPRGMKQSSVSSLALSPRGGHDHLWAPRGRGIDAFFGKSVEEV